LGREDGHSQNAVSRAELDPVEANQSDVPGGRPRPGAQGTAKPTSPGNSSEEARRRRLAAALRDNLKRRKDQSRQKRDLQKPGPTV
jgi:hypothetical protein